MRQEEVEGDGDGEGEDGRGGRGRGEGVMLIPTRGKKSADCGVGGLWRK